MDHPVTLQVSLTPDANDTQTHRALSLLDELGAVWLGLRDDLSPSRLLAVLAETSTLRDDVAQALRAAGIPFSSLTLRPAHKLDWSDTWDAALRPTSFGPLTLVPPGETAPSSAKCVLHVDAGETFGTGLHPTTALCLQDLVDRVPLPELLDVGTGSGVLALAALRLGAPHAVATDHDPAALQTALHNALGNGLAAQVQFSADDVDVLGKQFALVYANILAAPLISLAPKLLRAVSRGGALVLSGIRDSQVDDVTKTYRRMGARARAARSLAGWTLLEFAPPW